MIALWTDQPASMYACFSCLPSFIPQKVLDSHQRHPFMPWALFAPLPFLPFFILLFLSSRVFPSLLDRFYEQTSVFSYIHLWGKENNSSLIQIFLWPSHVFPALHSGALQCLPFIHWIQVTVQSALMRWGLLAPTFLTLVILPHAFSLAWPQLNSSQFVHEWSYCLGFPSMWVTCLAFLTDAHLLKVVFLRFGHILIVSHICVLVTYKFSFYLSTLLLSRFIFNYLPDISTWIHDSHWNLLCFVISRKMPPTPKDVHALMYACYLT